MREIQSSIVETEVNHGTGGLVEESFVSIARREGKGKLTMEYVNAWEISFANETSQSHVGSPDLNSTALTTEIGRRGKPKFYLHNH